MVVHKERCTKEERSGSTAFQDHGAKWKELNRSNRIDQFQRDGRNGEQPEGLTGWSKNESFSKSALPGSGPV
jgi:hypothetical protein